MKSSDLTNLEVLDTIQDGRTLFCAVRDLPVDEQYPFTISHIDKINDLDYLERIGKLFTPEQRKAFLLHFAEYDDTSNGRHGGILAVILAGLPIEERYDFAFQYRDKIKAYTQEEFTFKTQLEAILELLPQDRRFDFALIQEEKIGKRLELVLSLLDEADRHKFCYLLKDNIRNSFYLYCVAKTLDLDDRLPFIIQHEEKIGETIAYLFDILPQEKRNDFIFIIKQNVRNAKYLSICLKNTEMNKRYNYLKQHRHLITDGVELGDFLEMIPMQKRYSFALSERRKIRNFFHLKRVLEAFFEKLFETFAPDQPELTPEDLKRPELTPEDLKRVVKEKERDLKRVVKEKERCYQFALKCLPMIMAEYEKCLPLRSPEEDKRNEFSKYNLAKWGMKVYFGWCLNYLPEDKKEMFKQRYKSLKQKSVPSPVSAVSMFSTKSLVTTHPSSQENPYLAPYNAQLKMRKLRIVFAVLSAIFLTPLSLFISMPLLLKARREERIKKKETTMTQYQAVRSKRAEMLATFRDGEIKKTVGLDKKPKKVVLTSSELPNKGGDEKINIYMDRAQYKRYMLFSQYDRHDRRTVVTADEINKSYEASAALFRA